MPKSSLTLDNEFLKYCEINNITDPEKLAKEIFQKGFTIDSIRDAEIPAMPSEVKKEMGDNSLELIYNFIF